MIARKRLVSDATQHAFNQVIGKRQGRCDAMLAEGHILRSRAITAAVKI